MPIIFYVCITFVLSQYYKIVFEVRKAISNSNQTTNMASSWVEFKKFDRISKILTFENVVVDDTVGVAHRKKPNFKWD